MTDRDLFIIAQGMLDKAYAPFSNFQVGAALLTTDGKVFTGVNVENSSFGATICAERTAFVKAISEGYQTFDSIAVTSGEGGVLPCGICRQFMFEFGDHLRIVTGDDADHLTIHTIQDLLPSGFRMTR